MKTDPLPPLVAKKSARVATQLYLQYRVDQHVCGVSCRWVEQVIPEMDFIQVPGVPSHFRGLLRYQTGVIPVIDLCQLLVHRPAAVKLSTRIILLRPSPDVAGAVLGILAEHVLNVVEIRNEACRPSGIPSESSLLSGLIAETSSGWMQIIDPERLLPFGISTPHGSWLTPPESQRHARI